MSDKADACNSVSMVLAIRFLLAIGNGRFIHRMFCRSFPSIQRFRERLGLRSLGRKIRLIGICHKQNVLRETLAEVLNAPFRANRISVKPSHNDLLIVVIVAIRQIRIRAVGPQPTSDNVHDIRSNVHYCH